MNVNEENKTSKGKRIIAWICIAILVLLYVALLVVALLGHGFTDDLFAILLIGTITVPVFGFVIIYLYSRYNGKDAPSDPE
ncbi:MAG: hypothetical protein K6A38_04610 [Lachnospiraceae bacterium]|nr:hypothetical protein [Lachnospiraceae bacterium]